MKNILIFSFLLSCLTIRAQQSSATFFVQAQVNVLSNLEMQELESNLRANPSVAQARIDVTSGQLLVISKNLSTLSESDFRTMTGLTSEELTCLFVGVYGADVFKVYPFTNCNN
jgi:hypothetical protein